MKPYVHLLEGREWTVKDSYVKLKVGRAKSKTRVVMNTKTLFGMKNLCLEYVIWTVYSLMRTQGSLMCLKI